MEFPRTIQDDFVFVFKRGKDIRIFGPGDAKKFEKKLIKSGFVHTKTLSASVVLENLLAINQKEQISLIADLST